MTARVRARMDGALLLAVVAAVVALHVVAFGNRWVADDTWFAGALEGTSLAEFLAFRYQRWSGRLPIEAALVWMVWHPWAWKLANASMWLLFCHSAGRIAFAGTPVTAARATAVAFAALMLVSPEVLFASAWWMTGSINYLWPMALGLHGLRAFVGPPPRSAATRAGMLLASSLAMYNEQVAIALLPATALLWWSGRAARRGVLPWDLAQLLAMVANAAVVFAAPGSRNRVLAEQALRFPDFQALDPLHRAAIGMGLVFDGLLDPSNLLVLLLAVMVAALVLRSPAGRGAKAVIVAMLAYVVLGYLRLLPGPASPGALNGLYDAPAPDGATASSTRAYAASAWAAFSVACLAGGAVLAAWRSRGEAAAIAMAMGLGLASVAALGFSPTAYASGWRIHFVGQVAVLLVALRLGWRWREEFGARAAGLLAGAAAACAAWRVLVLLQSA